MCKAYTVAYIILFQCEVKVYREDLMWIDVQSPEVIRISRVM
jgi:hypothetical protein